MKAPKRSLSHDYCHCASLSNAKLLLNATADLAHHASNVELPQLYLSLAVMLHQCNPLVSTFIAVRDPLSAFEYTIQTQSVSMRLLTPHRLTPSSCMLSSGLPR
jgi:hypothetical protein